MGEKKITVFVSPQGDDRNAGTEDKPLATPHKALEQVRRQRRKQATSVAADIVLRGGRYPLRSPLVLTPEDSGTYGDRGDPKLLQPRLPLRFRAYENEQPVLSAGKRITGFTTTTVSGKNAWVVSLPEVKRDDWKFSQLWVDDKRAQRPRLPCEGWYQVEQPLGEIDWSKPHFSGEARFVYQEGELRPWYNVSDVEFVACHFWVDSRVPFKSIDPDKRIAELDGTPRMRLTDDHTDAGCKYYVENVFEALQNPGEFYLDRAEGKLYYIPRSGEDPETSEVVAPELQSLVRYEGDAFNGKTVQLIDFEDIVFSHNEYPLPEGGNRGVPQAAASIPGALQLFHAYDCRINRCAVEHVGSYAIEMLDHCFDVSVARCRIRDMGAGGVKAFHSPAWPDRQGPRVASKGMDQWFTSRRIKVMDNEIAHGGHRWHQAVGVLIGRCPGNEVIHNHIHHLGYTGVSVGWYWGYGENHSYGNVIEYNCIHDLGQGVLSDMGGIYTLGVSIGSRLRYNYIYGVEARGYGGWGIYPDEGSSNLLIEKNLTHDTKGAGFHQHYGLHNQVRNNIFAFGREPMIHCSRPELATSTVFERNIVIAAHESMVSCRNQITDEFLANCYWTTSDEDLDFGGDSWQAWQNAGYDKEGIAADPGFRNAAKRDFRLKKDSPAVSKQGFEPFDVRSVGPREHTGPA